MNYHPDIPGSDHPIALESPATIAIIGGGPIGLEAALYAKFLGYVATLFEQGEIAENVRRWGHSPMLTPFQYLHSRLGLSALQTQNQHQALPGPDELMTGERWREQYLLPLATTDLVAPTINEHCEVISISRCHNRKHRSSDTVERWQDGFHVVWKTGDGYIHSDTFDFILDASGTFQNSQSWGPGGGLAAGETDLQTQYSQDPNLQAALHFTVPRFEQDPSDWARRRILVVGDSFIAAQTATRWVQLGEKDDKTQGSLIWIMDRGVGTNGPYPLVPSDPLFAREALLSSANRLAQRFLCSSITLDGNTDPLQQRVVLATHTNLSQIGWDAERRRFNVRVQQWHPVDWDAVDEGFEEPDEIERDLEFDQVVIAVGHRVDLGFTRELNIPCCPQTECLFSLQGPLQDFQGDRFQFRMQNPAWTRTPEGRYFVLGAKSFGRQPDYYYRTGLQQVRDAFRWIVGRADLDLETTIQY